MSDAPSHASASASWAQALLRPLAADDAGARFWVRHAKVGVALSELAASIVLVYVVVAERPHRTAFLVIALVVMACSPILLLLPIERWSTSLHGPLIFYGWSIAVTVVIVIVGLLDGGAESPLMWLFVLTMTFAALAYPPLGVLLVGALMVAGYLSVAVIDDSLSTGTIVVAAILVSFTAMTAWVASNHWDTYEQQRLLTARHAELDRAREEFIATTSHEVRTPVASILGYVELLEDSALDPAEVARFLVTIRRNAERLKDLSEDLLVLSHWENEERRRAFGEQTHGVVDLADVSQLVAETLAPLAAQQGISLTVEAGEPLTVAGSHQQLERAVLNLAGNAVKYTPAGGHVVCAMRRDGGEAVISVQDTGIGIAPEELQRLFSRFFRASSARARSIAGAGLGLSIAHEIITSHGGRIEVSSELDRGTTFVIRLPCTAPPSGASGPWTIPIPHAADQGRQPRDTTSERLLT